jgi:phospholipase/lecithinase/hemolysin
VGTGNTGTSRQGHSVSLSSDGNTLAVGGYTDNSNIGATWIFTRSGSTWTQQGSKLVGTGSTGAANQGSSVSLSSDGNTLAIGGYVDNSGIGATWIFTRSGSTWTQQGSKLVGTGGVGLFGIVQGSYVSLSKNGNTLAVGAPFEGMVAPLYQQIGATWIFT